uniref:Pre-mRNA-splicing factor 38B n=1 Tax=Eptatretus burgeri TaxID=7764 RepID=A0A8C4WYU4_EPTBU
MAETSNRHRSCVSSSKCFRSSLKRTSSLSSLEMRISSKVVKQNVASTFICNILSTDYITKMTSIATRVVKMSFKLRVLDMLSNMFWDCLCDGYLHQGTDLRLSLENTFFCSCRYVRLLGAIYMRLTGTSIDCFKYLEPLYNDYRKIKRQKADGEFDILHVDEFIDELLHEERACDIILPRIQKRHVLEETEQLEQRVSALDEDLDEVESSSEEEELEEPRKPDPTPLPDQERRRYRDLDRPRRTPSPRFRRSKSPVRRRSRSPKRRSPSPRRERYRSKSPRRHRSRSRSRERRHRSKSPGYHRSHRHRSHSRSPDRFKRKNKRSHKGE